MLIYSCDVYSSKALDETPSLTTSVYYQINKYSEDILNASQQEQTVIMYDFDSIPHYLYIDYGNSGYLVFDIINSMIVESSPTSLLIKNIILSNDVFYNGPLSYYSKEGTYFTDLYSGIKIHEEDAKTVKINENLVTQYQINTENSLVKSNTDYTVRISGSVPNYSYNPNGICGSTAAAMWLRYMDINVSNNYVPSNLESTNGVSLIQHLVPLIDGDTPGSTPEQLRAGLQSYLNIRGINRIIYNTAWNSTTFKNIISQNTPVIVDLDSDPTYGEHWVVAYGYYVRSSPNISYIIVNNGWGNTNVHINPSYIGRIVY